MADNRTVFQRIGDVLSGRQVPAEFMRPLPQNNGVALPNVNDEILFSTNDKAEYDKRLLQMQQQKLLSYQWVKAGADNAMENLAGYTAVKLMYRDSDLMDGMPEIGTALDIYAEEACCMKSDGKMLNIYSKSNRVKSILDDLFVNRLKIHVMLPMIAREMCKYGNAFMLLNIDQKEGIKGWMKLPVYEIDRLENGYDTAYAAGISVNNPANMQPGSTKFVWVSHTDSNPYNEWQVAHFRMLNDAFFLPYGTSVLHKARRAWRMWSMMEDAMLIYRLDKSIERRVFKIFVGAIDDADVPAYVNQIANNFKRTPVIDPATGQVDLRKNFMDVSTDYFIPVRSENSPNPIETLQGAQNQTAMDDIGYMQNKVFSALRVPKTFLNFQEAQGKGQNLSIMDIRFARMINRVQQFLLMELNKIAMLHLYFMGMTDDLSNFTLSLNNPSSQIESQELDELTKRVTLAAQVLTDPGVGMPIFSLHKTLKEVMKMSDKEIKEMFGEIRVEKAMAAELAATQNIIKKTGMFDEVDRIYGDYDAMNGQQQAGMPADDGMGGGAMGGGGGMPMGGMEMDDTGDDMSGGGDMGMDAALGADSGALGAPESGSAPGGGAEGGPALNEIIINKNKINENNLLNREKKTKVKSFVERYFQMLESSRDENEYNVEDAFDFEVKNKSLNEEVNQIMGRIDGIVEREILLEKIDDEIIKDDE